MTMLRDYLNNAPVWERLIIWGIVGAVAIVAVTLILGATQ